VIDPLPDSSLDHLLEYRAQLIARLEQQPADMARLIAAIPEADWHRRADHDSRTVHQIASHVRDLETLAFLPRVRRILTEERPILESFASHRWSEASYRADEPMAEILRAWSQARAEMVDLLRGRPSAAWARIGFHPPSGNRTLQWWAERAYLHTRDHLTDMREAR
jgi:hypothetical protein